jgi:hypothetical protein
MHTLRLLFLDLSIHTLHVLNLKKTKNHLNKLLNSKKSATLINNMLCATASSHGGFYENYYFLQSNAVLWQTEAKINGITYKDSNFQHSGSSSYSG